ncbi:MAG: hypothetical protein WBV80_10480 [Mycobacterium sp.]
MRFGDTYTKHNDGITVVAVLVGGALLGIVVALVAIPIAATLQLLTQEVFYPRLDEI